MAYSFTRSLNTLLQYHICFGQINTAKSLHVDQGTCKKVSLSSEIVCLAEFRYLSRSAENLATFTDNVGSRAFACEANLISYVLLKHAEFVTSQYECICQISAVVNFSNTKEKAHCTTGKFTHYALLTRTLEKCGAFR